MDLVRAICQTVFVFTVTAFAGLHSFLDKETYLQGGLSPTGAELMTCAHKAFAVALALSLIAAFWVLKQQHSTRKNALIITLSLLGTVLPVGLFCLTFEFWADPIKAL